MKGPILTDVSTSAWQNLSPNSFARLRARFSLPQIFHPFVCAILGCAFVAVSTPRIWEVIRRAKLEPISQTHATDAYMVAILKVRNGSERLLRIFSSLPPERPVAVVLREGDDDGAVIAFLVSYFGWPREVHLVRVNHDNVVRQMHSLDRFPLSAIFYCRVDPPASMPRVVQIGKGLAVGWLIAPLEAKAP